MENELIITGYGPIRRTGQKEVYLRYLLGKFIYEETGISEQEILNFHLVLQDLIQIRPEQRKISELILGIISEEVIKYLSSGKKRGGMKWLPWNRILVNWLPDPFEYFGKKFQGENQNLDTVILRFKSVKKRTYPPARFIGVGYRDKGSRCLYPEEKKARQEAQIFYYLGQLEVREAVFCSPTTDVHRLTENLSQFFTEREESFLVTLN